MTEKGQKFCHNCGRKLNEEKICEACGLEFRDVKDEETSIEDSLAEYYEKFDARVNELGAKLDRVLAGQQRVPFTERVAGVVLTILQRLFNRKKATQPIVKVITREIRKIVEKPVIIERPRRSEPFTYPIPKKIPNRKKLLVPPVDKWFGEKYTVNAGDGISKKRYIARDVQGRMINRSSRAK